jgi:hypothetical protein
MRERNSVGTRSRYHSACSGAVGKRGRRKFKPETIEQISEEKHSAILSSELALFSDHATRREI